MKVEVTQDDIDLGMPGDSSSCPIAHALRRTLGKSQAFHIDVGDEFVDIGQETYDLPEEAKDFVGNFDNRQPVFPFAFDLAVE